MTSIRRPQKAPKGLVFNSSPLKRNFDDSSTLNQGPKVKRHCEISPPPQFSVKARILILSDTHGAEALPEKITEPVDLVLHCGDLSQGGELDSYRKTIALLSSIRAPLKLVIPGNHDLSLDEKYWFANCKPEGAHIPSEARAIWNGKETAGIKLLETGTHELVLENGGVLRIYASSATPIPMRGADWAFGYETDQDIYNPVGTGISYGVNASTARTEIPDDTKVDIMMTHGPAKYQLDKTRNGDSVGCPHLFRALRRIRPRVHAFGHVHDSCGVSRILWEEEREPLPADDDGIDDGVKGEKGVQVRDANGVQLIEIVERNEGMETLLVNTALMGDDGKLEKGAVGT
ncbi:putative rhamnogalacturonate lyase C [Lachnellula hyalina]|uniref:Putative rhamnogalacturonate lyase C n=1 Tax=Lachnellula hyalina TaxID=1316788 RepID=A0A8H8QVT9_9HELO|nr:putative rhamnogalacturonate lyase C [Lachnellula hyalina]TVY23693.1 putative rhamnogalacturonate lyase C [Lachnellula hyalina]